MLDRCACLTVTVAAGTRIQRGSCPLLPNGAVVAYPSHSGEVLWRDAVTHSAENVGTAEAPYYAVELKDTPHERHTELVARSRSGGDGEPRHGVHAVNGRGAS